MDDLGQTRTRPKKPQKCYYVPVNYYMYGSLKLNETVKKISITKENVWDDSGFYVMVVEIKSGGKRKAPGMPEAFVLHI